MPDENRRLFPELSTGEFPVPDVVADLDKEGLRGIADSSVDFVVASHVLEHLADPIGALAEIHRVLRIGGTTIILLPDRRATFDRTRAPTSLDHLVVEHSGGVEEVADDHIVEFFRATSAPGSEPTSADLDLHRQRSIHVHCWSETEFVPVLVHAITQLGQHWSFVDGVRTGEPGSVGIEFGFVLRKDPPTLASPVAAARFETDWRDWFDATEARAAADPDEVRRLKERIATLETSTSWRVTAPLRSVSSRLRDRTRWGGRRAHE
jgi:SAM-dependent methyltransferase